MHTRILIIAGLLIFIGNCDLKAQSSRDPGTVILPQRQPQSTSKKKKSKKKVITKQLDDAVEDYGKLMKKNARKYAKMQRDMKKPQYADPTYFGHKKPPKKRPIGKRKMCKECGIVH